MRTFEISLLRFMRQSARDFVPRDRLSRRKKVATANDSAIRNDRRRSRRDSDQDKNRDDRRHEEEQVDQEYKNQVHRSRAGLARFATRQYV